jgi:hypothetical protein
VLTGRTSTHLKALVVPLCAGALPNTNAGDAQAQNINTFVTMYTFAALKDVIKCACKGNTTATKRVKVMATIIHEETFGETYEIKVIVRQNVSPYFVIIAGIKSFVNIVPIPIRFMVSNTAKTLR